MSIYDERSSVGMRGNRKWHRARSSDFRMRKATETICRQRIAKPFFACRVL